MKSHHPVDTPQPTSPSSLTEQDVYLFREGTHGRLYEKFGAHPTVLGDVHGVAFAVWAPNAKAVSVIGDFNGWQQGVNRLTRCHGDSGIWEGFVAGAHPGQRYKFHVESRFHSYRMDKGDPYAFTWETPPATSSRITSLDYQWSDGDWMAGRAARNGLDAPMSVYELHLGSWRRVPHEDNRSLGYREIAHELADYVIYMGFTHVEIMPVMEHPFYGSWGYQCTGYFAPTSRYGSPQDFMYLVDHLHQRGIGVILDWVPSHFPSDAHGLAYFDGTNLYEHSDERQRVHQEWDSYLFDYGRRETRALLLSSAMFWLDKYHVDGLRVDAVASMLYLDYARRDGDWVPNVHGGNENLEAISFLKMLNEFIYRDHPGVQTFAEESTAWPMVSRPVYIGGLGFGFKWNMGWMHDTLAYFALDPVFRKYHHERLTFSMWYAFQENFILPLSHDEVVHSKGSLLAKMPGDEWQQFANLRLLYGYMWAHPGKKLLFMGDEFGQRNEWYHESSLDWHLTQQPFHGGLQTWIRELNRFYRERPSLFQRDFSSDGFQWVDCHDSENSVLSFLRRGKDGQWLLVVMNATPIIRDNYRVGVPVGGFWNECLNSDAQNYGGSGQGNLGGVDSAPLPSHGHHHSLMLRLPPLGVLYFEPRQA